MKEPVLVIMAAGMGSRYGGLKQIDPVDDMGNLIIDFSIYDAIKAGFKKIVFIIKKEIESDFKEMIGRRISDYIKVEYVYQELSRLPEGYEIPEGRKKPWGTGHAVLCCMDKIDGPFAVINADDYYGREAFQMIYDALLNTEDDSKYRYSMVGYTLENTLTDHGHVARGVCDISIDGKLKEIHERTHIEKQGQEAVFTEDDGNTWVAIPKSSTVSMNMWGFTNSILTELNNRFKSFLDSQALENPLKSEYFLPTIISDLLKENKATVEVLHSNDKWFGVTYKEDKETVVNAIKDFKTNGIYPKQLWN
ncbi:nucleotidyltransferase-like protein [Mobilisporobacter senegalensis]|uniref:Nucleotidyltransferase-like protein n=1 Tax=Mobilisporobacter senegalensis TaxID=1329262 RepID=A0A3N1XQM9_9FIRM|nr:sugar phosphate nucleotidyltransferase [Mobilisporobacter senegalensis]ROR27392.1 nucleotidyltransferase-like protein [Mobilisporobacter senegalensis]